MGQRAEAIYEFLGEEGYRPKYDDDGDIVFKHEGDTYHVIFHKGDDDYTAMKKLAGVEIDDPDLIKILLLINSINAEYIAGKCYINLGERNILSIGVETLGSVKDFLSNFKRYLRIINQMDEDFDEGYSNI